MSCHRTLSDFDRQPNLAEIHHSLFLFVHKRSKMQVWLYGCFCMKWWMQMWYEKQIIRWIFLIISAKTMSTYIIYFLFSSLVTKLPFSKQKLCAIRRQSKQMSKYQKTLCFYKYFVSSTIFNRMPEERIAKWQKITLKKRSKR